MIRFAHGGHGGNIGFHEIPIQYGRPVQTVDQLGEPLSGGCVRQAPDDAIWMWNWAQRRHRRRRPGLTISLRQLTVPVGRAGRGATEHGGR